MIKEQEIIRSGAGLSKLAKQLDNVRQACKTTDHPWAGSRRLKTFYAQYREMAFRWSTRPIIPFHQQHKILWRRAPMTFFEAVFHNEREIRRDSDASRKSRRWPGSSSYRSYYHLQQFITYRTVRLVGV